MPEYKRPSWDDYFLEVMHALAKRATCDRGRTACLIVKDNQIVVSGYVGSPPGLPHCDEVGHLMKTVTHEDGTQTSHCMRTLHAEQNAICQAAKRGVSIEGATLYCKLSPCPTCSKLLIACGIKRVDTKSKCHDHWQGIHLRIITVGQPDALFRFVRLQHSASVHGSDGGTECRGNNIE